MNRVRSFKALIAFLLVLVMCMPMVAAIADEITGKEYVDGLIVYRDGKKKYGYMDMNGNIAIKASKFISAQNFSNGLAVVQTSSNKMARDQYIDKTGKTVIKNIDTATRHYGYQEWQGDYGIVEVWEIVKKPNLHINKIGLNYINANGKLISKSDFMYTGPFAEGYALVGTGTAPYNNKGTYVSGTERYGKYMNISTWSGNNSICAATKYHFIDKNGEQLGNLTWDTARSFSNGFAAVGVKAGNGEYLWGFINDKGQIAVGPQWSSVSNFNGGYARVKDGENYGYLDTTGEVAVECIYEDARDFGDNGLAAVKVGYNWGFINGEGEMMIKPQFSSASAFAGGYAVVEYGAGWGVIDTEGNFVINPSYESVSRMGNTGLYAAREYAKPMIINEIGKIVSPLMTEEGLMEESQYVNYPEGMELKMISAELENGLNVGMIFDDKGNKVSMNVSATHAGSQFFVHYGSGKIMLMNTQGERAGKSDWDGIGPCTDHWIAVARDNLYGLVDTQGKVIRTPQFTRVSNYEDGMAVAYIGSTNAIAIDELGRDVLPDITKKSSKDDIKRLNQALIDQGFMKGKANSSFEKTPKAIKAAQEAFGMEITGVADSEFQYRLFGE